MASVTYSCRVDLDKYLEGVDTGLSPFFDLDAFVEAGKKRNNNILEDIRSITFKVITTDNTSYDEVVDISEIPFREGRTTRISIHVEFMDADRCNITIKDLGFGEFVKSSGKVIHRELTLRS